MESTDQRFFIGAHRDRGIVAQSSSGGAFYALLEAVFREMQDVVVYGCSLDLGFHARHIRAESLDDCLPMRGSKYVESDLGDCLGQAVADLESGSFVVFSGTPCQIAGLLSLVKLEGVARSRLLTLEVACHGVGSPCFFADYLGHLEKRFGGRAVSCSFRSKDSPGQLQDMGVRFDNGRRYHAPTTKFDEFYSVYQGNYILRPSCFQCKFAQRRRCADITLADAWQFVGQWPNGVSLLVVNSDAGLIWVEKALNDLSLTEAGWEDARQNSMVHPTTKPSGYERFCEAYRISGYEEAQKVAGNRSVAKGVARIAFSIADSTGLLPAIRSAVKRRKARRG